MNNKSCLVILSSTNSTYDTTKNGVKVTNLREIKQEFERDNIEIKFCTFRGKNPILNFENEDKNRNWVRENQELFSNLLNYESLINTSNKYDGILIPNFISIYEELKISDNALAKLILSFQKSNKIICCIGHSVISICNSFDGNNDWPFVNYNITGVSIYKIISENLYGVISSIVEEQIILQGGHYLGTENNSDEQLVVVDKNLITGYDDYSFILSLQNFIHKLKF